MLEAERRWFETHPSWGGKSPFPHLTDTINGEFDLIDTAEIAQNWAAN
jgi:hypothetical protein